MTTAPVRVLYVDDDDALARLVQRTLGRRNFEIVQAPTVEHALEMLSAREWDVLALDHFLANGTGLDFLKSLAGAENSPPVVYVTGSTEMSVAVAALKAGAVDFVPKTVGDDFLVLLGSALEQAVEKAALLAQKEAAEREVRVAKDRAEMLLAEVNHRVANSLAIVSSLVNMQANAVSDQAAKDALAETHAQIFAIALVHKRLYSSGDVSKVDLQEYITGLLDHLRTTMRREGLTAKLSHNLAALKIKTDQAVNLGIIVTEWVTNCFKYAYPHHAGEIRVRLQPVAEGLIELAVEDDGVGRNDDRPVSGSGLGTRIVSAMAISLDGKVDYIQRSPGTTARLVFPHAEES